MAKRGVRQSETFATKGAAKAWGTKLEADILDGKADKWPRKTLADAMSRYEREITPTKGAARFESVAFGLTLREHPALCAKVLHTITPADIAEWRDARLREVSGSTVVRYAGVLRNVWTVAAREWKWCPKESPWSDVKLPQENPPRERINGWREIRAVLRRLNYYTGRKPSSIMEEVAYAWLIALRTALRAAEVRRITPQTFNAETRVVTLHEHKTKHLTNRARHVPVSKQAARLISIVGKFTVKAGSLDAMFRKAREACGLEGFTFHDSRATALTLLSRRVDILTLQRISGHRNIQQLTVYYRESSASIAARL